MNTRLLVQSLAVSVLGILVLWLVLFALAGTVDYWQAWVFVPVFVLSTNAYGLYFSIRDPAVIERRKQAGPGAEQSRRQKVIATLAFAGSFAVLVVAALDRRFEWSQMAPTLSLFGNGLVVLAYGLYTVVSAENPYAGASIRVEPGQRVISTGPYARVRHPKYVGDLVLLVGVALALGSWWSLAILPLSLVVLVARILDEERTLAEGLPGYADYLQDVRVRLLPRVW